MSLQRQTVIYAGIDEAGLGPTLGPFVVGVSAFAAIGAFDAVSPSGFDFYTALSSAVSIRKEKNSRRVWVTDSKQLFTQSRGLFHIEEALLPFILLLGEERGVPFRRREFWTGSVELLDDDWKEYPWYLRLQKNDHALVPQRANVERILMMRDLLAQSLNSAQIRVERFDAIVMPVRAFNRSLSRTRNKARTAFEPIKRAMRQLWEMYGEKGLVVKVDKQGGRSQYSALLGEVFEKASIETLRESHVESRYFVQSGPRSALVSFVMRSDESYLPVSLASVIAKYMRETLMGMQNEWFARHNPDLRPTAGYPQDALRWLEESADVRKTLGVADGLLIRNR